MWLLRHSVSFQSHSRALTFQHRNVVWTKNKEMFLDAVFSKLLGKQAWRGSSFLPAPAPTQPSTEERLSYFTRLDPESQNSTVEPQHLHPSLSHSPLLCGPAITLSTDVPCLPRWARESTCQLTSRYPWLFRVPHKHPRATRRQETLGWGTKCHLPNSPSCSPPPGVQPPSQTEVGEVHSGGRADTASRIHLPLINRGSPN